MATIRFDDAGEAEAALWRIREQEPALADIAKLPRITGAHLCATDGAASAAKTAESRGRTDILPAPIGVVLIEGCDEAALRIAVAHILKRCRAETRQLPIGFYRLECARANFTA